MSFLDASICVAQVDHLPAAAHTPSTMSPTCWGRQFSLTCAPSGPTYQSSRGNLFSSIISLLTPPLLLISLQCLYCQESIPAIVVFPSQKQKCIFYRHTAIVRKNLKISSSALGLRVMTLRECRVDHPFPDYVIR
jgi:hypothetical protein